MYCAGLVQPSVVSDVYSHGDESAPSIRSCGICVEQGEPLNLACISYCPPGYAVVSNMNTVHAHALSTLGDFSARDRVLSKLVFRAQYVSSAVQLRDQGLRLLGRCFTPPFLQFLP